MTSFNFEPAFVAPIAAGTKVQTIRRLRRCVEGGTMHLFTGLRTKACRRLGDSPLQRLVCCAQNQPIFTL